MYVAAIQSPGGLWYLSNRMSGGRRDHFTTTNPLLATQFPSIEAATAALSDRPEVAGFTRVLARSEAT